MAKRISFDVIVNYLFVFLAINYTILSIFVFKVDSKYYGLILCSFLVFLFNIKKFETVQLSRPVFFWLIWCFYAVLNYIVHPSLIEPMDLQALYRRVFIPLITMTVAIIEYRRNPKRFIWLCTFTTLVYAFLGFYYDTGILFRDLGEDNILGNTYAITTCFGVFYIAILNRICKVNLFFSIFIMFVLMLVLAMSGTRKAFGAGMIMIFIWALSFINLRKTRSWLAVAVLIVMEVFAYNYFIENTFMGQRMEYLEEQAEEFLPAEAPQFLAIFGDRAPHYYYGWQQFLERPFFGVGLAQSRVRDISTNNYFHTEFIVQLTDNGLVGFIFFFLLYYWIAKRLYHRFRTETTSAMCFVGGFIVILFLEFTAWAWDFPHYFLCLGTIIGYCKYGYGSQKETAIRIV